jgi:hypothetical protein
MKPLSAAKTDARSAAVSSISNSITAVIEPITAYSIAKFFVPVATSENISGGEIKKGRAEMPVTLTAEDYVGLVNRLVAVLNKEDVVKQQAAIELLTMRHALRMGDHALFVADSVHKHVVQLINQAREDR